MDNPAKDKAAPGSVKNRPLEELEIGSVVYRTRLTDKFKNRIKWERPEQNILTAVIPGTVQQIMVEEGTEVVSGTPILILEAMKMRNVIVSPVNGMVKKIFVKLGEQVPKDFLLVQFE